MITNPELEQPARHSVLASKPLIRFITQEDIEELVAKANDDNHKVVAPTHVVVKDGEIAGYLSHGAIPTVHVWLSTKKIDSRDTVHILPMMEQIAMEKGSQYMCMPCADSSPYISYMAKFGYANLGHMNFFVRKLY